jgi:hypothetical protein
VAAGTAAAPSPPERSGQVDQGDSVDVTEYELGVGRRGTAVIDDDYVRVFGSGLGPGAEPGPVGQLGAEQVLQFAEVVADQADAARTIGEARVSGVRQRHTRDNQARGIEPQRDRLRSPGRPHQRSLLSRISPLILWTVTLSSARVRHN